MRQGIFSYAQLFMTLCIVLMTVVILVEQVSVDVDILVCLVELFQ